MMKLQEAIPKKNEKRIALSLLRWDKRMYKILLKAEKLSKKRKYLKNAFLYNF